MSSIKTIGKNTIRNYGSITLEGENLNNINVYLDPINGNDSNDGSYSNPWKTIKHAFDWIETITVPSYTTIYITLIRSDALTTFTITDQIVYNKLNNVYIAAEKGETVNIQSNLTDSSIPTFNIKAGSVGFESIDFTSNGTINNFITAKNSVINITECSFMAPIISATKCEINFTDLVTDFGSGIAINATNSIIDLIRVQYCGCGTLASLKKNSHMYLFTDLEFVEYNETYGLTVDNSSLVVENTKFSATGANSEVAILASNTSYLKINNTTFDGGITSVKLTNSTKAYMNSCTMQNTDFAALYAEVDSFIYSELPSYVNCDTNADPTPSTSNTPSFGNSGSWIYELAGK